MCNPSDIENTPAKIQRIEFVFTIFGDFVLKLFDFLKEIILEENCKFFHTLHNRIVFFYGRLGLPEYRGEILNRGNDLLFVHCSPSPLSPPSRGGEISGKGDDV